MRDAFLWITFIVFLVSALGVMPVFKSSNIAAQTPVADLWIYNDALLPDGRIKSYNDVTVDYATRRRCSGTHSIAVTYTGGWSGCRSAIAALIWSDGL